MTPRCFMTFFMSRYDKLAAAKHHYHSRLAAVRQRYQVTLITEQVENDGDDSALFRQLVQRTTAYNTVPEDEHSLFVFSAIILAPDTAIEEVIDLLDADPGVFVSHTEVIRMSPTGGHTLTPVSRQV